MGGSVVAGGTWTLVGCTMAPGFTSDAYEGGVADELAAAYPGAAGRIAQLTRLGREGAPPPAALTRGNADPQR